MEEPSLPPSPADPMGRPPLSRDPAVLAGLALYLALFVIFFPQAFATSDETSYLREAWAIQDGQLLDRGSDYLYKESESVSEFRSFSGRSLLFGLILAPFVSIHWKAAFLVGLGFHLANFLLAATILGRSGVSRWWAWLVLLHPTHTLFSRTVLMDVPSATFALGTLALLCGRRSHPAAIGVVAGLSMFVRMTNCWIGLAAGLHFLVADFFPLRGERSFLARIREGDLWKYLAAFIPFCVGLLASNAILYGGLFATRYAADPTSMFGFESLLEQLPVRMMGLNLFWPLMLGAIFFLPKRLRVFGVSFIVVQVVFFSLAGVLPRGYDLLTTSIRSSRYLTGPIAVLCIGYPFLVRWAVRGREIPRVLAIAALVGCTAATLALFWKHDGYLAKQASATRAVYANTPEGSEVFVDALAWELFNPAIGKRKIQRADHSYRERGFSDLEPGVFVIFRTTPKPWTTAQEMWIEIGRRMEADLARTAELEAIPVPETSAVRIFRVVRRIPGAELTPLSDAEWRELAPRERDLPIAPE